MHARASVLAIYYVDARAYVLAMSFGMLGPVAWQYVLGPMSWHMPQQGLSG